MCDEIWTGLCYSNVSTCKYCSRNRLSCFDCIPCVQLICPRLTENPCFIFHLLLLGLIFKAPLRGNNFNSLS